MSDFPTNKQPLSILGVPDFVLPQYAHPAPVRENQGQIGTHIVAISRREPNHSATGACALPPTPPGKMEPTVPMLVPPLSARLATNSCELPLAGKMKLCSADLSKRSTEFLEQIRYRMIYGVIGVDDVPRLKDICEENFLNQRLISLMIQSKNPELFPLKNLVVKQAKKFVQQVIEKEGQANYQAKRFVQTPEWATLVRLIASDSSKSRSSSYALKLMLELYRLQGGVFEVNDEGTVNFEPCSDMDICSDMLKYMLLTKQIEKANKLYACIEQWAKEEETTTDRVQSRAQIFLSIKSIYAHYLCVVCEQYDLALKMQNEVKDKLQKTKFDTPFALRKLQVHVDRNVSYIAFKQKRYNEGLAYLQAIEFALSLIEPTFFDTTRQDLTEEQRWYRDTRITNLLHLGQRHFSTFRYTKNYLEQQKALNEASNAIFKAYRICSGKEEDGFYLLSDNRHVNACLLAVLEVTPRQFVHPIQLFYLKNFCEPFNPFDKRWIK